MSELTNTACEREYDFALIAGGVPELTTNVEDSLFNAGCDDATLSIQYGFLYLEFSRRAKSLDEAILSAIHDVRRAGIGAEVMRVDECNLVTAAEIARRIGRTRQLVHQYMTGERGPGGFPPPECCLCEGSPLWAWCTVSYWLSQNGILRPEESWNAEVVSAINNALDSSRQWQRQPKLVEEISRELQRHVPQFKAIPQSQEWDVAVETTEVSAQPSISVLYTNKTVLIDSDKQVQNLERYGAKPELRLVAA